MVCGLKSLYLQEGFKDIVLHKYLERIEKSCLYNAHSVVTLTDASKKYLIHKYENFPIKNFEVIPTCVDLEKFYFRYPISNEIRVGCVGTVMSGWFDINLLLRFFNAIFEIYQNPSFEIVTTDNINDVMEELSPMAIGMNFL